MGAWCGFKNSVVKECAPLPGHKSWDALVPAPRSGSVVDATPFPRLVDTMDPKIETVNGPETTQKMKTANHQGKTTSILLLQTRMRVENAIKNRTK